MVVGLFFVFLGGGDFFSFIVCIVKVMCLLAVLLYGVWCGIFSLVGIAWNSKVVCV